MPDHIPWILFLQALLLMFLTYGMISALLKSFCEGWHKMSYVRQRSLTNPDGELTQDHIEGKN